MFMEREMVQSFNHVISFDTRFVLLEDNVKMVKLLAASEWPAFDVVPIIAQLSLLIKQSAGWTQKRDHDPVFVAVVKHLKQLLNIIQLNVSDLRRCIFVLTNLLLATSNLLCKHSPGQHSSLVEVLDRRTQ